MGGAWILVAPLSPWDMTWADAAFQQLVGHALSREDVKMTLKLSTLSGRAGGWVSAALLAAMLSFVAAPARADSPLTSTDIAKAYEGGGLPELDVARGGVLVADLAQRLLAEDLDLGSKVALVNALGWDTEGKANSSVFIETLEGKYGAALYGAGGALDANALTTDELVVLGYLTALDNYFAPWQAIGYLDLAVLRAPESLTVNLVLGLVRAQLALAVDWCQTWQSVEGPLTRTASYVPDIKIEAVDAVDAYMGAYRSYCP